MTLGGAGSRAERENKMKITIASFSFHGLRAAGMMDGFGYLETVKHRYGLDAADFWNGILGPDELVFQEEFQARLQEAVAERELTVANYHVDGCHIWEDDPAVREKHHQAALAHLQVARRLGARTMRIDAGARGRDWNAEQFDLIVKRYREYAGIGADAGFRVGPENHWGPELVPDNMERLARAVDHPGFGILLHIGRWPNAPEEEGDRRLAPWAVHAHVEPRIARDRLEPAIRLLLAAGYQGYWGVEQGSGQNEYAEAASLVSGVRRVLEKIRAEQQPAAR